jgi:hypothetical protein
MGLTFFTAKSVVSHTIGFPMDLPTTEEECCISIQADPNWQFETMTGMSLVAQSM